MPETVTNEHLRKEIDNFEKTGNMENLLGELQYSSLIIPINHYDGGCPIMNVDGKTYVPVFTDIHEYQKVSFDPIFEPEVFDFNFYLEILEKDIYGLVVNFESERFPVTQEFLDFMDTNYMFDLDYQPFTRKEIRDIYDSADNRELNEFIMLNRWDLENMMEVLKRSDLLTLVVSEENLDDLQEKGVICSYHEYGIPSRFTTEDDMAVLFSSKDKINIKLNDHFLYSSLVNLGLFIDSVLKNDLAGIRLDGEIVFSREFLINYMKDFRGPCIDWYDDYLFLIE